MALERDEFTEWMRAIREDMREEARALRQEFREGIEGVHDRLDDLNGRTRTVENKVAVIDDRGSGNRDTTARVGGIGGLIAAATALFWQWVSK